mgnify:CR=1 FL=1
MAYSKANESHNVKQLSALGTKANENIEDIGENKIVYESSENNSNQVQQEINEI